MVSMAKEMTWLFNSVYFESQIPHRILLEIWKNEKKKKNFFLIKAYILVKEAKIPRRKLTLPVDKVSNNKNNGNKK